MKRPAQAHRSTQTAELRAQAHGFDAHCEPQSCVPREWPVLCAPTSACSPAKKRAAISAARPCHHHHHPHHYGHSYCQVPLRQRGCSQACTNGWSQSWLLWQEQTTNIHLTVSSAGFLESSGGRSETQLKDRARATCQETAQRTFPHQALKSSRASSPWASLQAPCWACFLVCKMKGLDCVGFRVLWLRSSFDCRNSIKTKASFASDRDKQM